MNFTGQPIVDMDVSATDDSKAADGGALQVDPR
jgi:hypothetical protein